MPITLREHLVSCLCEHAKGKYPMNYNLVRKLVEKWEDEELVIAVSELVGYLVLHDGRTFFNGKQTEHGQNRP